MVFTDNPYLWFGEIARLMVMGVAVFVAAAGRFRGLNLAFGLYLGGLAAISFLNRLGLWAAAEVTFADVAPGEGTPFPEYPAWVEAAWLFSDWVLVPVTVVGLLWLAARFPGGRGPSRGGWIVFGLFVASGAVFFVEDLLFVSSVDGSQLLPVLGQFAAYVMEITAFNGMLALAALLAVRYPVLRRSSPARAREAALVAAALVVYPAIWFAPAALDWWSSRFVFGWSATAFLGSYWAWTALVTTSGLWFRASLLADEDALARRVAIWTLIPAAAGFVAALMNLPDQALWLTGALGMFATALLMAYAVLRHQLLGVDLRTRWTISKSTVAAIFLVVFFVVSEAAQEFFGQRSNSTYIGIAAAGTLLFMISPIQRWADRLAHHAVPDAPIGLTDGGRLYERLARRLTADGELSPDDRQTLAHSAQAWGLATRDAHEILGRIVAELPGAGHES